MSFKKAEKKSKEAKKLRVWPPGSPASSASTAAVGGPGGSGASGAALPEGPKSRLWELFGQIEHEFQQLHSENATLRERIEKLEQLVSERPVSMATEDPLTPLTTDPHPSQPSATPSRKIRIRTSGQAITQKLKNYTPSKKSRSHLTADCQQVCLFSGHRDGVWQVSHARNGLPVIGTASADGTACVWDVDSSNLLLKYVAHTGSVNSLTFHPDQSLACTVSGDHTAHIWRCAVNIPPLARQRSWSNTDRMNSSGEERNISDDDIIDSAHSEAPALPPPPAVVKSPLLILPAHKAPVMSCEWLHTGNQLVTASWDHTAKLWDSESAQVIHSLEGHDQELTHVCAHPTQQLVVTSSQDATFRLWDFRAPPIHSVNVFQGHNKAVNSAVFSQGDNVVSGSDDHTLKIWDLRNMRSPVDSVRLDCGINRLAVSYDDRHILAVPLDNRHIKLYDLTGSRLAHLPRRNRQGHHRMVYSVAWSPDSHVTSERCNLFSSGFDNKVIGWKITA